MRKISGFRSDLRKALTQPADVVAFKLWQKLNSKFLKYGGWGRISRRVDTFIRQLDAGKNGDAFRYIEQVKGFISSDGLASLRRDLAYIEENPRLCGVFDDANHALAGSYPVFGSHAPLSGKFRWDTDWRYDYIWQGSDQFDFYADRDQCYDVKYPWELSRLKWLVDLVQVGALKEDDQYFDRACLLLSDWISRNPLGCTVNWVPMEASMRSISMALALEIVRFVDTPSVPRLKTLLVRSLIEHGEFIYRTREFSHNRGNHYAANICALFHVGHLLSPIWNNARTWKSLARKSIALEVRSQFLQDGVNFEKSASYHRLVTELFMSCMVIALHDGDEFDPETLRRLELACRFANAAVEPDGTTMALGDCDDATGLPLGPQFPWNVEELCGLAAAFFAWGEDQGCASLSARWAGYPSAKSIPYAQEKHGHSPTGLQRFDEGHIYFINNNSDRFWCDLGEVGQNGVGGHGHNDLFSFALWFEGKPIIVDPGSYMYTGDLSARDWFRSSSAHNGFVVDSLEIAEMSGHWRIANSAEPFEHVVEEDLCGITLGAAHAGYTRSDLAGPVRRRFRVASDLSSIQITDGIDGNGWHIVERHFHLHPSVEPSITEDGVDLWLDGQIVARIDPHTSDTADLRSSWFSRRYGERVPTNSIVFVNRTWGAAELGCTIHKVG